MLKNNSIDNKGGWIEPATKIFWSIIGERGYLTRIDPIKYHDWEDCLQEILVYIWAKRRHYHKDKPLGPWLRTIISRQILNKIRATIGYKHARAKLRLFSRLKGQDVPVSPLRDSWDDFVMGLTKVEYGVLTNPLRYSQYNRYRIKNKLKARYLRYFI
jgi:hypothetical protein